MLRLILTLGLFGGLVMAGAATADDTPVEKKVPPGMNGGMLFKKVDANGDGKVSKDEFKDFLLTVAGDKLKGRERLLNRIFQQADTDGDGYLSPDEFKALVARFRDRIGKAPKQ
jgi:hypothetical protein